MTDGELAHATALNERDAWVDRAAAAAGVPAAGTHDPAQA